MDTDKIQTLLHHRPPYLMVSEVIEHSPEQITTLKQHEGDEGHLTGHFPGHPVVPGAMMQELCTQSAGILLTVHHSPVKDYDSRTTKGHALGVLHKVKNARYLKMASPQRPLTAQVELVHSIDNLFEFKARVLQDENLVAKMTFQLLNLSDSVLDI
jgi:3-hydroxyacyl-[acyl-carrier-protein] dehydratase